MKVRTNKNKIRHKIAEIYSDAIIDCSSNVVAGQSPVPQGVAAKLAGYSEKELVFLPAEAVVASYGCGHPVSFADIKEGDVIIELGCGAGIDLLLASPLAGESGQVIGIDMVEDILDKAQENIAESGVINVELKQGLIEELPVESETVDLIISNGVINLSPEKEKVFAEIFRVLKPGGRLVFSDIVADSVPHWIRTLPPLNNSCINSAVSVQNYRDMLIEAQLTEVQVKKLLSYNNLQLNDFVNSELRYDPHQKRLSVEEINKIVDLLTDRLASVTITALK